MDKVKVTCGKNAYSFHDQSTGITICRGEVVELTNRQINSTRVRKALNSGHLAYVQEASDVKKKYSDSDIEKLIKKLKKQVGKGMEIEKIAKSYSEEEIQLMALNREIELEAEDSPQTILEALVEVVSEED